MGQAFFSRRLFILNCGTEGIKRILHWAPSMPRDAISKILLNVSAVENMKTTLNWLQNILKMPEYRYWFTLWTAFCLNSRFDFFVEFLAVFTIVDDGFYSSLEQRSISATYIFYMESSIIRLANFKVFIDRRFPIFFDIIFSMFERLMFFCHIFKTIYKQLHLIMIW